MLTMFDGRLTSQSVTLPYRALNTTHGQCLLTTAFTQLAPLLESRGQVQTNLRLFSHASNIFIDSPMNGRLALLFYKCEVCNVYK